MSSSIFFRFKSRKDALQINFDGTSLSVFEVKREIMSIARLGDGKDFDLDIYSSDTNELYDDDTTQIPRSTTVIVRRQPAQRPGAGRASRYVNGQMPLHARSHHRLEANAKGGFSGQGIPAGNGTVAGEGKAMTEEERLQAIMNASNTQLKADLEMSANKPVMRPTYNNKSTAVPDKPLPPGYVCHRCGGKGHWIQACPTNTDPAYDGKHKFKRTTGIPRSMLEVVEKPDGVGEDGKIDPSKIDKGLMYTANGEWVRARPDQAAWQKFQEQQKASAEKAKEIAEGDQELRERGLECPVDNRPFADPTKTPCCGKTYCRDCIENALLDNDLACPNCGKQVILESLSSDDDAAQKLAEFEAERKVEKQQKKEDKAQSPPAETTTSTTGTPKAGEVDSPSAEPTKSNETRAESPQSTTSTSKKRSADSDLENTRKPNNPAASKASSTQVTAPPTGPRGSMAQPAQAPNNMMEWVNQMNAMSGNMPGMPNNMEAFNNPMMMNAMNMGMPMGMMPGMMGMPNFDMMNGMNGMGFPPNMNMNMNMNGMNNNMGWQNNQQQQSWGNGMGRGNMANGADNGAYFRQPVNPHRHQGKQRRQRSVDYREM